MFFNFLLFYCINGEFYFFQYIILIVLYTNIQNKYDTNNLFILFTTESLRIKEAAVRRLFLYMLFVLLSMNKVMPFKPVFFRHLGPLPFYYFK